MPTKKAKRGVNKNMVVDTSIGITSAMKADLDSLKVHPRESYGDIIFRLMEHYKRTGGNAK